MKVTFGLPEIVSSFGCLGLVQSNYWVGGGLLALGVIGSFLRFAIDTQEKKESSQKIENGLKSLKQAFSNAANPWDVSDKNVH